MNKTMKKCNKINKIKMKKYKNNQKLSCNYYQAKFNKIKKIKKIQNFNKIRTI